MPAFRRYTEAPDLPYRLGRHQMHDFLPLERDALGVLGRLAPIQTVTHKEYLPVFNQGQIGSCTANAALGLLVTAPFGRPGVTYTEADAVRLYELETRLDDSQIPGEYPPQDTGSSGPWSMMALEQQGLIRSWVHTRATHTALQMLNAGPISIGVPWFRSMVTPDSSGTIHVDETSDVVGGHQVCIVGDDAAGQRIRIRNSWGPGWGDAGHCWLSWADFDFLLGQGGDVVQPVMEAS